ncbi:nitroreductase family protein [Oscillibacter sp. MSJ-2]|uniref:Nitroreductase family protein n=1 Tax=Dysosmobacter acutus TaxID=2841504 RepID=A0ABS6FDJ7_9FIRM|nr:nitroreductase family protein [Dysosmobacter acutus]MBU5627399.1 nitroreductase family protein [Dysosmobacter acutus]
MKQRQVIVDTDKCIGCGLCRNVCVAHNLVIHDKKAKIVLDECVMCGQCSAVCPKRAISLVGCGSGQMEKAGDARLAPDDILNTIRFRRSVRSFQETEIPQRVIEQILEAGRLTHTAKNMQDVSYVVLTAGKDRVEKMAVTLFRAIKPVANLFSPMTRNNQISDQFFFFSAPAVIVILAKDKTNGVLAAQNMEFVAEANGLGVLYSGFFTMAANMSRKIKKEIGVPKGKKVAMTLVLGYPNVKFLRSTPHKELEVRYM